MQWFLKRSIKNQKKVVKKWQKTVFNPDFYQPFNIYRKQRIAKLANVYQIDTMMGKQDDQTLSLIHI